ncbi:MAG: TerB family tellurite resistance protein [Gammaproteobacteria bacterium TMED134]|nr:MAG: TerB family tellurite resistance protein [Gammaproteobacteria bacterium TMED134]RZO70366.1 MAG: TerB family tellurite resistance protein [OM182 bacterium]|tara:strand:- start:6497 stop:6895 length:399 start_codon:yes stop_codon:yes gene_type:complete
MWLASLSDTQRQTLMRLAHNVIVSDGLLDPNEEGMLDAFRREMELAPSTELEYLELEGIDAIFPNKRERLVVLFNLCRLSYADGAFEVEEECLLNEIRRAFGVTEEEFQAIDEWTGRFSSLMEEARDMLGRS